MSLISVVSFLFHDKKFKWDLEKTIDQPKHCPFEEEKTIIYLSWWHNILTSGFLRANSSIFIQASSLSLSLSFSLRTHIIFLKPWLHCSKKINRIFKAWQTSLFILFNFWPRKPYWIGVLFTHWFQHKVCARMLLWDSAFESGTLGTGLVLCCSKRNVNGLSDSHAIQSLSLICSRLKPNRY